MTLQIIANDIADFAVEQLTELGLAVVSVPSDDPSIEDHAIEFRNASGLAHAVSVQVSSYSPSFARTSLSIKHVATRPIEGTDFTYASLGWQHSEMQSKSRAGRIGEIVAAIRANNWFVPVDDLASGIVTDFRMETIIPKLREHFDGPVRLSQSATDGAIDTIEILDDDKVVAKTAFVGQAVIRLSYATLAGDERIIDYKSLNAFDEAIDRDLGGNPAPSAASGPRV
jgi:hypothetical protein